MDYGLISAILLVAFDVILTVWALKYAFRQGQERIVQYMADGDFLGKMMVQGLKSIDDTVTPENVLYLIKKHFLMENKEGGWVLNDKTFGLVQILYQELMGMFQRSTDGAASTIERRGSGGALIRKTGWMHDLLEVANHPLVKKWMEKKDLL